MTYPCPIESCDQEFEQSRDAAVHVRWDHQVRYPTDQAARDDFADLGIQTPDPPYHRAWNQRIPRLRPRKVV